MSLNSSTRTPKWRSSSTSKKRAPTSLSLVFASPEQGAPLGSAAEKLPITMADDAASLRSFGSGPRKRESMDSVRFSAEEPALYIPPTLSPPQEYANIETEFATAEATFVQGASDDPGFNEPAVPASPEPIPVSINIHEEAADSTPTAPLPEPITLKPQSSSSTLRNWFGSLTPQRGRDNNPKSQSTTDLDQQEEAGPSSQHSSSVSAIQVTPAPLAIDITNDPPSTSSQPIDVPAGSPPSRSWFASASYSPPNPESPLKSTETGHRPPHVHVLSNTASISSVDDEVPQPKSALPELSKMPDHVVLSSKQQGEQASMNTSAPRFTLRIPLLGRPKIPLDQAVAVAQAEDIRKPSKVKDSTTSGEIPPSTDSLSEQLDQSQSVTVTTAEDAAEAVDRIEETAADVAKPLALEHVRSDSSSWWGYVGWNNNTPSIQATSPADDSQPTEAEPPEVQVQPPTEVETQPAPAEVISPTSDVSQDVPRPEASGPTVSIRSAETGTSAWYAPWTWTPSPAEPAASQDPGDTAKPQPEHVKTESEMVKEEALAREDPPSPTPASVDVLAAVPSSLSENPIQSSLVANKSSWSSFFTSRAVKNITESGEKKEDEDMEIMEISDDEDASAAPIPVKPPQSEPSQPPPPEKEPKKNEPPITPITNSESVKKEVGKTASSRPSSPNGRSPIAPPNLVLPTWGDTFHAPPRSLIPPSEPASSSSTSQGSSTITKTLRFVSGFLGASPNTAERKGKGKERETLTLERDREVDIMQFGRELPRALDVVGDKINSVLLSGECKVAIIGIAGWSPGAVTRTIAGGLPSSSSKFVAMTYHALKTFQDTHGVKFRKITQIPLEGDGTVARKVDKVHQHLMSNLEWLDDLHEADVVFVAAHSQGTIVAAHLIDRLLKGGHINTEIPGPDSSHRARGQKICCLSLCGIHLGPLRYLKMSSFIQPYIQYFESAAAKEIFDFQNTETPVSQEYVKALKNIMRHGTKMVYVASLNDQVVPIYSGLFTAASHPHILRALYIDGDAYHSSDFLSNLLVLLLRIMNSGLSDSGLLTHLSEATAGSLSGVGHSSVYEEPATFSLAVNYMFLTNDGSGETRELVVEPFDAVTEQNDYEIPWSLRDLIANDKVAHFFSREFIALRDAFGDWHPKTTILRDVKRKLQPIQRLSTTTTTGGVSKL